MDIKKNPFPNKPPKYVRMILYHYHFTGSTNNIVPKNKQDWWSREFVREYLPVISLEQEDQIKNILNQMGIATSPKKLKPKDSVLRKTLNYIRDKMSLVEPHILVWSISLPILPIMLSI